jgi:integrase/recombinase XerD
MSITKLKKKHSRQKWDKQKIIQRIRAIASKNKPLNAKYLKNKYPSLYWNICTKKYFNSLKHALYAAGYEYDNFRLRKDWSKQKIISEIKYIFSAKEPLNASCLKKKHCALYSAITCKKYFSTLFDAITAAGLDHSKTSLKRIWSKQKIINGLKLIASRGEPLHASYLAKNYMPLYGVICGKNYFKGLAKALAAAGFDYNKITLRKFRSTNDILEEIKHIYKKYKCLKTTLVQASCPGLLRATRNNSYLKNWKRAVEKAGFTYYKVTNAPFWNKSRIINNIKILYEKKVPLTENHVKEHYFDLYTNANKKEYFNGWENALIASDVNIKAVREENILENTPFLTPSSIKHIRKKYYIKHYINEYLDYERFVRKSSISSIVSKRNVLIRFRKYLASKKYYSFNEVSTELVRSYFVRLRQKMTSPVSLAIIHHTLNKFYGYCVSQGYCDRNPTLKIGLPQMRQKLTDVLTESEAIRIIKYAAGCDQPNEFIKTRDLLIICLFLMAGLRPRDILNLEKRNISFSRKIIVLSDNSSRIIPLADPLLYLLKQYLPLKNSYSSEKLITTHRCSKQLTVAALYDIIKRITNGAKISKNIYPNNLRLSFISLLLNAGANILFLHKLIGYKDINRTAKYSVLNLKSSRNNIELMAN